MTHITLGCGGHRLSDVNHDQPAWLAATAAKFGYGRVTVDDGYSLTFEFVRTDVSALQGLLTRSPVAGRCCVHDDLLLLRMLPPPLLAIDCHAEHI
jgi:Iron/zinc purple acid phosphatase-like protein C